MAGIDWFMNETVDLTDYDDQMNDDGLGPDAAQWRPELDGRRPRRFKSTKAERRDAKQRMLALQRSQRRLNVRVLDVDDPGCVNSWVRALRVGGGKHYRVVLKAHVTVT